jgi:hypothetical protein
LDLYILSLSLYILVVKKYEQQRKSVPTDRRWRRRRVGRVERRGRVFARNDDDDGTHRRRRRRFHGVFQSVCTTIRRRRRRRRIEQHSAVTTGSKKQL